MIFFLPSFLGADKKNHPKKYAMGGIWLPHLNIWRWKFSHDFFVLPAGLPTRLKTHWAQGDDQG